MTTSLTDVASSGWALPSGVLKRISITSAQRRIFLQCQLPGGEEAYHLVDMSRFRGPFSVARLRNMVEYSIQRHEALRTGFRMVDGELMAEIHESAEAEITEIDGTEDHIYELAHQHSRPFDLSRPSLMRVLIIRLSVDDLVIVTTCHHLVFDGYSAAAMTKENAMLSEGIEPPPIRKQYSEFLEWSQSFYQSEAYEKQKVFWLDQFKAPPPRLDFPRDFPARAEKTFEGGSFSLSYPAEPVRRLCMQHGSTMFMALLSSYYLTWYLLTGKSDITIGTMTTSRESGDFQDTIGLFANTLALRQYPQADQEYSDFLAQVKSLCVAILDHSDYPFEHFIEDLPFTEAGQVHPLFDVVLTYEKMSRRKFTEMRFNNLSIEVLEHDITQSMFPLTIDVFEAGDELEFKVEYRADMYRGDTIKALVRSMFKVLAQASDNPKRRLGDFQLIDQHDLVQLREWNNTSKRIRSGRGVLDLFLRQVQLSPENPAVHVNGIEWTYAELFSRCKQFSGVLQEAGVQPGGVVAVGLERSADWVAAVFAVWSLRAIYLPLDPTQPSERLNGLITDATANHVMCQPCHQALFDSCTQVILLPAENEASDSANLPVPEGSDPAVLFYTSGSTGKPKGVLLDHRALTVHVHGVTPIYRLKPDDNVLQFASQVFDASLEQMLAALCSGSRLVIPATGATLPVDLVALLEQTQVTVAEFPPSYLNELLEQELLPELDGLRLLISGGDVFPSSLAKKVQQTLPHVQLMNFYGPTEAAMAATVYPVPPNCTIDNAGLPIGSPLANTRIYLLSPGLKRVPPGLIGELFIGGERLAREYVGRDDLTRESFVVCEFDGQEERLYRSGDYARWRDDGLIEFVGRKDNQVQLRGQRIELGEVEGSLLQHPYVDKAVVAEADGVLRAFLQLNHQGQINDVQQWARQVLPVYMIPASFLAVESFPVNAAGKVDRSALLLKKQPAEVSRILPADTLEHELMDAWLNVLKLEQAGMHDDFFQSGGHSLSLMRLLAEVKNRHGLDLPLARLMQPFSLLDLCEMVRCRETNDYQAVVPVRPGGHAPPLFLLPGIDGNLLSLLEPCTHLAAGRPIFGLQLPFDDAPVSVPDQANYYCRELADHSLEQGILLGYSAGAYTAFEMARHLEEAGIPIATIIVIDVPAPGSATGQNSMQLDEHDLLLWMSQNLSSSAELFQAASGLDLNGQYLALLRILQDESLIPRSLDLTDFKKLVQQIGPRLEAYHHYRPDGSIDADILLVRAEDERFSQKFLTEDGGWSAFTTGQVNTCIVHGHHFSMLKGVPGMNVAELINHQLKY